MKLSVPHFFFLRFLPEFDLDLARLGLARRSNPDGAHLTAEQDAANTQARQAVIRTAVETAVNHFPSVNVRFVTASPAAAVGAGNFTTVRIGGMSMDPNNTEYGAAEVDPANPHNPDKSTQVNAGEFAQRGGPITDDPLYRSIFGPLATEDAAGGALAGVPVDAGEVVIAAPATPRQMIVRAAVTAFGRFIGSVAAHEAGHVLIPSVSASDIRGVHEAGVSLMMPANATFVDKTGIVSFDAAALMLAVVPPLSFGPWFRKRLVHRYPTGDIELSEYD